ncbi:unnamed protein product [Coregonus sp. 'balchen']|nr:unnamed protein product [Coregonus sp. 'balchen']
MVCWLWKAAGVDTEIHLRTTHSCVMELDKMDENDWKYHGEGNKSLVVSHVQHARVLRLLKYSTEDAENSHKTTEQAFHHIQNIVDYSQNVMKPLLGEKFVHNGEAVKLPLDFVRQLSLKVQQERPVSQWKVETAEPVLSLGPVLRVVLNELIQVIVSALLSSWDCPRSGQPRKTHLSEGRVTCEASLLPRDLLRNDCVLDKILGTQMLDSLDIEGLNPLFKRVEQYLQKFPKERSRLQIDGPYNQSFLEKVQNCPAEDDGSVEYAVGKVHQYRVAMTAKDCSIMVAIATCGEDDGLDQSVEIQPAKPRFNYSVSILDLDPKPYESVSHQSRLDAKIVNHYLRRTQPNNLEELANQSLFLGRDRDGEDCTLVFHPV